VATFDDLQLEVRKLRRQVRRLEGGNAAANNTRAVDEIVSTADGDEKFIAEGGGGGFAAACAESHATLGKRLEQEAIRDIRDGQTEAESSRLAFYRKYNTVLGRSKLDSLILEHRR
jgi:hypothetical protein